MRVTAACVLSSVLSAAALAAPPAEVAGVAIDADRVTVSWEAAAGAEAYHVYLGASPAAYDQACRVYRAAGLSATVPETPGPGELLYVLVSAVNAEGEGPLGAPNTAPCADGDGDLAPDNLDNCPLAANPSQADQDGGGSGDACDPRTYDFQADAVGARPAGMTRVGGTNQALTVKDLAGDHGISYDRAAIGAFDRFDRVPAGMTRQDTTVWVDYETTSEVGSIELWSDGAYGWRAGDGIILQWTASGGLTLYQRHGQAVPPQPGPAVPASGRIRVRLVKGPGTTSTLHVDRWDGAAFAPDHGVWTIDDDHRFAGLASVIADYSGGTRAITRITVDHAVPAAPLTVRQDPSWSCDWKLFQRGPAGTADVPVKAYYALDGPGALEVRVVRASDGAPLPGFDWADHALPVAASPGAAAELVLPGVPAGENYDIELRLVRTPGGEVAGEGRIEEIAVGELFLAGGQSNMSGYSGNLNGAEAPEDEVHLFHNDYRWKRAVEPMDDGADQVDLVSSESPAHSLMLAFGKELRAALGVPVGIIPGPLGGTNLHTQWQRNAAVHDDRGTLYGSLLHRALLQGGVPARGFLWYQGESDAGRGTAAHRQDLERLMAQYREDLANPELWFGIVQLATYDGADFSTWIPIQEAHRQVVENDPRAVLSAAVDLPRADVIHLNVEGYKTVGRRLAREMEEHLYGLPVDASARLVQIRLGGGKSIDLEYDRPVTGGTPSLYRVVDAGGILPVNSVTSAGSTITLNVQGRPQLPATVTYGYSKAPGAAWVKDAAGTAVAVFQDVPVQ